MIWTTVGLKIADKDFLSMLEKYMSSFTDYGLRQSLILAIRNRVPFQVVLTKCDLIILPTLARRYMMVLDDVSKYRHASKDVAVVSSRTQAGVNQLRKEILKTVGQLRSEKYYLDKTERQKDKEVEKNGRK
jgi:GTP-binding protein EngB required for normal cell division